MPPNNIAFWTPPFWAISPATSTARFPYISTRRRRHNRNPKRKEIAMNQDLSELIAMFLYIEVTDI